MTTNTLRAVIFIYIILICHATAQVIFPPPLSSAAPTTVLPASTLPNVSTSGTIHIGMSISVNGQYSNRGVAVQQSMQLWQTTANNAGGITINGTHYYFSLTTLDDGSQAGYVYDIYSRFAQSSSPNIDIFLGPSSSSATTAAVTAIANYHKPLVAVSAVSDSLFTASSPYVYDAEGVASTRFIRAMSIISALDPPIETAIIFARIDGTITPFLAYVEPYLTRLNISWNIVYYTFPADSTSIGIGEMTTLINNTLYNYTNTPDLLLLAASSQTDFNAFIPAFNTLMYSPKLCIFSNSYSDTPNTPFETSADGWIVTNFVNSFISLNSTLSGTLFENSLQYYNLFQQTYGIYPGIFSLQASNVMEVIMAALTISTNVSTNAFNQAIKSLNGSTIFSPFTLEPNHQYNVAASYYLYQLRNSVQVIINNPTDIQYPYVWPWIVVVAGDDIPITQTANYIPLAALLAIAGSWVALILVETVVLMRRQHSPLFLVWLLLMSISLGVASGWTSIIIQYSALNLNCAECLVNMNITFAIQIILCTLLTSIIPMFLGLYIIATGVVSSKNKIRPSDGITSQVTSGSGSSGHHDSSTNTSTLSSGSNSNTSYLLKKEQKKIITLNILYIDLIKLINNIIDKFSLRYIIGTALITSSFVITRQVIIYSIISNVNIHTSIITSIISSFIIWLIFITPAIIIYFHSNSYRFFAVILITSALLIDYQYHFATLSVTYNPTRINNINNYIESIRVNGEILILIASLIGAISGVIFIGLQFNKMKLSHHSLAIALLRQKQKLERSEKDRYNIIKKNNYLELINQEQFRLMDANSLLRPLSSITDKAAITVDLIWVLNATVSQSQLIASAVITRAELLTAANAAGDVKSSFSVAPSAMTSSSPYFSNGIMTANDNETDLLTRIKAHTHAPTTNLTSSVVSYHPSLHAILSHPLTLEIFKDEVERSHSVENILFLNYISKYTYIINKNLRHELAIFIFEEFIAEGSSQQININAALRLRLKEKILQNNNNNTNTISNTLLSLTVNDNNNNNSNSNNNNNICNDLFEECCKEIRSLLITNQWKHFISTTAYTRCAIILLRNVDVMNAIETTSAVMSATMDSHSQQLQHQQQGAGGGGGGGGVSSVVKDDRIYPHRQSYLGEDVVLGGTGNIEETTEKAELTGLIFPADEVTEAHHELQLMNADV